jgi:hypothetical protein
MSFLGLLELGGCLVGGSDPNWHCSACGHEWEESARANQYAARLAWVHQHYESLPTEVRKARVEAKVEEIRKQLMEKHGARWQAEEDARKKAEEEVKAIEALTDREKWGHVGPCPKCGFAYRWDGARCAHCREGIPM